MSKPGKAAVISFIFPGVGQFYNGDFLRGIFWLIITTGMRIGSGGLLGWIAYILTPYTAHLLAEKKIRGGI